MREAYRFTDDKSDKFWMIDYAEDSYMVNYGKTGTMGRFQVKEFDSEEECKKQAEKQIASKVKKGYQLWADFDFDGHLYFDDDEETGLHPKTSHPRFSTHFTEDFYYSCGDEEAPFGSDDGSDTYHFLCEYIKKHRETNLVDFPRNLQENDWGLEWFEPTEPAEAEVKSILDRGNNGHVPIHRYLLGCDRIIVATALGQIKVMGKVFERLRHMALCSLKRMAMADRILGYRESYTIPQMIKDLESYANPPSISSEDASIMVAYLGCPCEVFAPTIDDDDIQYAYEQACKEGAELGYTPLLVVVSDTLLEAITLAVDDDSDMEVAQEKVSAYRQETIQVADNLDAAQILKLEEALSDELVGKIKVQKGEVLTGYTGHWNFGHHFAETGPFSKYSYTHEVILAKLPTEKPWEAAIYVPMGGFNDCPAPEQQAAVMKYWYEKYDAVPTMVSYDTWEFTVPPLIAQTEENFKKLPETEKERLMALAEEHYAFCTDRIDQYGDENYTLSDLASSLAVSTQWYFWWD